MALSSDAFNNMASSGRYHPVQLAKAAEVSNRRRVKFWARLAEILFNLVCLLWGKLSVEVINTAGKAVPLTDPSVAGDTDAKLNAIGNAVAASQTSTLLRDFFRPLLVAIAELIAEYLSIDESMINLHTPVSMGGGMLPMLPGQHLAQQGVMGAPPVDPAAAQNAMRQIAAAIASAPGGARNPAAANGTIPVNSLVSEQGSPTTFIWDGNAFHQLALSYANQHYGSAWSSRVTHVPPGLIPLLPQGQMYQ